MRASRGHRMRHGWLCGIALLGGCAHGPVVTPVLTECAPPARRLLRDVLYFGLQLPSGVRIDTSQWEGFLAEAVTPRFPSGYTVLHAAGHWRDGGGQPIQEPSKVLIVLHAAQAGSAQAVADIIQAYKARFTQESVLRETTEVCAEF